MRFTFLPVMSLWMLGASAVADDPLLAQTRWRELGYGLSLQPPRGATVIDDPPGDALVAFLDADGSQYTLTIRQAANPTTIDELKTRAAHQLSLPFPSWLATSDPDPLTELAGFPAGRIYMAVPDKEKGDWVMGHVFVLLDDFLFVNLQLEAPAGRFADAHRTFTAVARSIELMDRAELDDLRTRQLEAGQALLRRTPRDQWLAAAAPSQLFRVLVGGQDAGYMKLTFEPVDRLGLGGYRLELRVHLETTEGITDITRECFESDDDSSELWTTDITTRRTSPRVTLPTPDAAPSDAVHLHESGSRDARGIEVHVQTRTRLDESHRWPIPSIAYLSQFKQLLLGSRLAGGSEELAFYCYSPDQKKLSLMMVRVEPITQGALRGGHTLILRPDPAVREQAMLYDAAGRLIEWRTGTGQVFRATTPDELRRIWNARESSAWN